MPKAQTWLPWVPRAWLSDEQLTRCEPATRGIWADALAVMHVQGRTGRLRDSAESLARQCRCSPAQMLSALQELKATGTADVTDNGDGTWTVINRRMRREHERRSSDAKRKKASRDKTSRPGPRGSHGESHAPCPQHDDYLQTLAERADEAASADVSAGGHGDSHAEVPAAVRKVQDHPCPQSGNADTITALADYLAATTGARLSELDLENLADEDTEEALIVAVEVRAAMGRTAFKGMAHGPVAALRHSMKTRARPDEPGAFRRWQGRRAAEREKAEQLAWLDAFRNRTPEDRAARVAEAVAAGLELPDAENLALEMVLLAARANDALLRRQIAAVERHAQTVGAA